MRAILGFRSCEEETLKADEILDLDPKTLSCGGSCDEEVEDSEFRYLGLEFLVRRRFAVDSVGAERLRARRRFADHFRDEAGVFAKAWVEAVEDLTVSITSLGQNQEYQVNGCVEGIVSLDPNHSTYLNDSKKGDEIFNPIHLNA